MHTTPTATITLTLRSKRHPFAEELHPRDGHGRFAEHLGSAPAALPHTLADPPKVPTATLLAAGPRSAKAVKAAMCGSLADRMSHIPDSQLLSTQQRDRLSRVRSGQLAAFEHENGPTGVAEYVEQADLDSGHRQEPWGYTRMTSEEYQKFVRTEAVSHLIAAWAATANDHYPPSLALQEAARQHFDLAGTMEWDTGDYDIDAQIQEELTERGPVLDAFLTAMWDTTQDHFATLGIDHVTVHRGFVVDSPADLAWAADGSDTITDLPLRPISSFTTDQGTAEEFATHGGDTSGLVMSGDVPVSRILAVPGTGIGCLDEAEVVVLAGPGTWHVYDVHPDQE